MENLSRTDVSAAKVNSSGLISFTNGIISKEIPYHKHIPFERRVLVNDQIFPGSGIHIAAHFVKNAESSIADYAEVHKHDMDEINLVFGDIIEGGLVYRIRTDSHEFFVESPQSLYIPRGTPHAAEAVKGSGVFVCILLQKSIKPIQK